jgi:hypothetical protein
MSTEKKPSLCRQANVELTSLAGVTPFVIVKFDGYLPNLLQNGWRTGVEQFDLGTFDVHFQQIEGPCFNQIKKIGKLKCAHLDHANDAARWIE